MSGARSARAIWLGPTASVLLLWMLHAACTSSQTAITEPTTSRCGLTVANSIGTVPESGGAGSLVVTAARDCTWAASNTAQWVVFTSATSGQGDGSIAYRVAANNAPSVRRATIEVNTASVEIVQAAAECRYTVTAVALAVASSGGSVTIEVQSHAACGWTATSDAAWARITAGSSGQGDGRVTVAVDANAGAPRSARITVAGSDVVIEQASGIAAPPAPPATCAYTIQPGGQTMVAGGGPGTIGVTASLATCSWTAVANAAWITITGAASGTGNGNVTFTVEANPGASRTGTISIAGQTFTLSQAGAACNYSIAPSSEAMSAAGGTSTISVTTGGSCAWTAAANVGWITLASGGSGTGPGTVRLNVAANTGAARTGTATIAAQTFTVTQAAAPCGFSLSPAAVDLVAAGGEGKTTVTAGASCAWTAVSNAPWITVTAGASGTGNGVVVFNAAANTGAARSGTIAIGGQTLTVTQQAAPCTFAIAPTSQSFGAAGGAGTVGVTAGATCGWTATSNNPDWLTITASAAGTGNGSIAFMVAANSGASRTGTLGVAGHTFTVMQDAPCIYAIAPLSQTIGAAAGSGTVAVTTGGSCSWTATSSNPEWLSITSGSSGTGDGQVMFTAAPNTTGAARNGTITIAGIAFVLTQTPE